MNTSEKANISPFYDTYRINTIRKAYDDIIIGVYDEWIKNKLDRSFAT